MKETLQNGDISKSRSTHLSTSSPARPPRPTSTSQPTPDLLKSRCHPPKNLSAAVQEHPSHPASPSLLPPARTAKTATPTLPTSRAAAQRDTASRAASPTARAAWPGPHRHTSPHQTIAQHPPRPAPCTSSAPHLTPRPPLKMCLPLHPS